MLRRAAVAISVGLADSVNPSTVGPGLYLATGGKRVLRVAEFTVGVFAVNFAAGVVLTIGPGRLLLGLVPHPQQSVRHLIELAAGVAVLIAAAVLWRSRRRLAQRALPMPSGGSAVVAGASIAAVELPTAAPYLAVIAGIAASDARVTEAVVLLLLYNVAFVLPLLGIIAVLLVARERAESWLRKAAGWLQRQWPVALASLLLLIGSILTVLGATGLVKR